MRYRSGKRKLSYEVKNGVVQAKLLERHVVREIVDRLWLQARIKVWVINQPVGGKTPQNVAGIPDLMGWIPTPSYGDEGTNHYIGRALYIEVKRPGGVRRPAQERFIQEALAGGCVAFFAESWNDVVDELARVGVQIKAID